MEADNFLLFNTNGCGTNVDKNMVLKITIIKTIP